MAARYFQNLNKNSDEFQLVTELDYIDDTDPSFVLYYFKNGSKCSKQYIAKLNETNVIGKYEYAEVSSPTNIWHLKVNKPKQVDQKPEYITGADGQRYEIPSELDYTNSKSRVMPQETVEVIKYPTKVNRPAETETEQPVRKTIDYDFNSDNSKEVMAMQIEQQEEVVKEETLPINLDVLSDDHAICYTVNNKVFALTKSELLGKLTKEPEVVYKYAAAPKSCDESIEMEIDDSQKQLLNNMIDMSQKEECDIDMCITLTLPPVSVYQLIKSVYPKGMSKAFVDIIANSMRVKELKMAVSSGLLAYYDEDEAVEVKNESHVNEQEPSIYESCSVAITEVANETKPAAKKGGRPKKADK